MRNHYQRLIKLPAGSLKQSQNIRTGLESRLPVGSSASTIAGLATKLLQSPLSAADRRKDYSAYFLAYLPIPT